jgi:hypothetical protein
MVTIGTSFAFEFTYSKNSAKLNKSFRMVNIGSLALIPTTLIERHVDFWAAFLLPFGIMVAAIVPVIVWHKRLSEWVSWCV